MSFCNVISGPLDIIMASAHERHEVTFKWRKANQTPTKLSFLRDESCFSDEKKAIPEEFHSNLSDFYTGYEDGFSSLFCCFQILSISSDSWHFCGKMCLVGCFVYTLGFSISVYRLLNG